MKWNSDFFIIWITENLVDFGGQGEGQKFEDII